MFFYRSLLKVERGSEMYKEGIRWTEFLEPLSIHKAHLVPDNILTFSIIILMVIKITVMITL